MSCFIIPGTAQSVCFNVEVLFSSAVFRIISHASQMLLSFFKRIVAAYDCFLAGFGEGDDVLFHTQ